MKSTQVQQEFGEAMDQALSGSDVIVERYGNPRVAIINYRRYQELLEAERQLLRHRLQMASAAVSRRAAHLSEAEIDDLIERARQEVHEGYPSK
jgi:TRAP-type C4-dicarboxylate transport system substrate-binding protein